MARVDNIQVFAEVVEAGNFTAAAQRLGLTPSAVSKHISHLEDRLGVQLLSRTTRSVNPTDAGHLYYDRCRQILEDLDEAEQLLTDLDSTPRGVLKIAAEPIFGRAILATIISDFCERYPGISTELFLTDHSLELVKQGFDAGIHLGELESATLASGTIAQHRVILCASPDYVAKHGAPADTAALNEHHLIRISSMEFTQPRQLDDYYKALNITSGFHVTVNDTDMAYQAVMANMGIAPLPNYLVAPLVQNKELIHILPDVQTESHPVTLVYHNSRHISSKTQSFIDFTLNYFN